MGTPIRHPLVDEITARVVRIESRAAIARLSAPLADLLSRPVAANRKIVLVTPDSSRLTIGLRTALLAAGGAWFVTTPSGFRDGITGLDHVGIDEAATSTGSPGARAETGSTPTPTPTSTRRSAEPDDIALQLSVDVSVIHHDTASPEGDDLLGGALEALCGAIGDYAPRAWGSSEPLEKDWDRWAMTQEARHRAPAATRLIVEGDRFSAGVTARVTDRGLEETIALTAEVPGGAAGLDSAIARLASALGSLTRTSLPTFALVLAREGERDRSFRAVTYPPPNPVALLIGAPSVERLALHERMFAAEQDVLVVGLDAHPAYLLPLGDGAHSGWEALHDALDSVGSARITTLVEPPLLQAWEDDLHGPLEHEGEPHPHDRDDTQQGATDAP